MRYTLLTVLLVFLTAAPTFAQSRFQGNGEWANIAQDAVRDRLRSRNRVWEAGEREKIHSKSRYGSNQIDVGEELKAIGVGWIAGEVLGRQANSLENERNWNRAHVDAYRDQTRTDLRIKEGWARTDQQVVRDQHRHSLRSDEQLLRANEQAYRQYLQELPQGERGVTFQEFLGAPRGASSMPQVLPPVDVSIHRAVPTQRVVAPRRPAGVATQVVSTTTAVATSAVQAVTGSRRIYSAEETRIRYGR